MLTYYRYLWIGVIKKKAIIVTTIIYFLFLFIVFNLVPKLIGLQWYYIWDNQIIGIHDFVYIILSIICAETTINIFADPKTNGSELIIIAKPINRLKIILTKFAVILSVCFLIVLIGSVFIVSAGKWDHKLAVTLTHFILATLVIFLLFSSIAIMMNIFTGKIGILCTTIGLAILISVMHLTIPLTVKTQGDYLKEKYGLNFISRPLMVNHPDGPEMIDTVGLNVFSETNSTKALINYVDQKTNGVAETYFDIGGQINKMFFADNDEHHSFNWYGSETAVQYQVADESIYDNLMRYTQSNFREGYNPLLFPHDQDNAAGTHMIWFCYSPSAYFGSEIEYEIYNIGGLTKNAVLEYNRTNTLDFDFINYQDVYDVKKWNDYAYANYIFDKYIWYGNSYKSLFNYQIDNYTFGGAQGTITLYNGFEPNKQVNLEKQYLLFVTLETLLSAADKYRNDKEVRSVYYPYLPPYNQNLIAEQNHVYDHYDPQFVPDFEANFRNGIAWNAPTSDTIYHQQNKSLDKYEIVPELLAALGPYETFDYATTDKEYAWLQMNQALVKMTYLYNSRLSNIFYRPDLYYDLSAARYDNFRYWNDDYKDQYFLQFENLPDVLYKIYDMGQRSFSWGYYIADRIFPESGYFCRWTNDGSTDEDVQKKIADSNRIREKYDSFNIYLGSHIFYYNGINDLKQTYQYDFHTRLSNAAATILWCIITLIAFALMIVVYLRTDFA